MQFFWEWLQFVFSPPLGAPHRVSSEAQSRAPPTFSHPRHPLAPRLVSQIYFGRFFHVPRWSPPTRSVGLKSKASLAPDPNGGSSSTNTEARRPVLLVEMIPKVEKRGFRSNAEKRDQKFFPKEGNPGYPRRREENFCLEESHFFLSKALWGGWREALVLSSILPPASHPTELSTRKSVFLQDRSFSSLLRG